MSYLIEVNYNLKKYNINRTDRVIIWSPALKEEIEMLVKDNPDKQLIWTRTISDDISEQDCIELSKQYNKLNYSLPQEYRENPTTVREEKKNERTI